ncbi:uncharacterized protein [Drosophila pseudoobscura]|uniref:Uncharacterized protein isoform X1 n=1 Tax=Drosophila pseudoobscura pseudoobscura TaxID=46245 RepID=A0A6I8UNZ3_DROPS|nr:uncharacterized protein LOC4801390 isoform X1 [Drosophila pseudoobscura]
MLSRKELIAVILMLSAVFSVLNAAIFANTLPFYVSYEQLLQQVISIGTAYLCILYALSTWMYHSNYSRTRQHMRYALVMTLLVMIAANIVAAIAHMKLLSFSIFKETTDISILFSKFDVACKSVSLGLSVLTILLLIIVKLVVFVTIIRKHKKKQRKKIRRLKAAREALKAEP